MMKININNKSIMYKIFLFFFTLFNVFNLNTEDFYDEKIIVKLETENALMPIYLAPIYNDSNELNTAYTNQIEKIFHFDLNHNGMTYTVKENENTGSFDVDKNFNKLKAYYVIKILVKNKNISLRLISINSDSQREVSGIALTGNISQDREKIHRLSDLIFKTIFEKDGIANTKILYTVKTGDAKKPIAEIFEADYDGGNPRQITKENCLCVNPAYIPPKPGFNSGGIMYISYKTGQSKIYIASLSEGIGRRFSLLKGNQLMPAVSKQRDKIAFICDYTGNPDLFLQAFDPEKGPLGKPQQIFSTHLATQGTPTFHPDGNKIAFVSNKDGSPRIYVIDIPAPGASIKNIKTTLISKANRDNTAPNWSPDGTKLAYCSTTNGVRQIWIYDFIKQHEWQLTFGNTHKENPSWAPNSLHLVFNSTGKNSTELYLVNLNQPEAVKITKGSGDKRFPVWEPK